MPPNPAIEYRSSRDVAVTEEVDGFSGYASTFWAVDSFATAMAPGAFKKSLKERVPSLPVLWQHNPDWAVGKHLAAKEDKRGLHVDVGIADDGAEGSVLLKRLRFGVPLGMSFGFRTIKSRSATEDDPLDFAQMPGLKFGDVQIITEVAYWESSAVTFPANTAAEITAVRADIDADALSSLLDRMRAGSPLEERSAALCAEIVAAYGARAEPEAEALPLTPDEARRADPFDLLADPRFIRARQTLAGVSL